MLTKEEKDCKFFSSFFFFFPCHIFANDVNYDEAEKSTIQALWFMTVKNPTYYRSKKKVVLVSTVLAVTIPASLYLFVRFVSKHKPALLINEKTIVKMGRRAGFDMDDPVNFGMQVEEKYNKLTQKQCRKVFYIILAEEKLPQVIMALPPDLCKEAIDKTTDRLRKYRESMTEKERKELRKKMISEEGQKLVRTAKYRYFDKLSSEERSEFSPIIDEILKILSEM